MPPEHTGNFRGFNSPGEGGIDDIAVDMRAEIELEHVVVLEHCLVPGIGSVVRRNLVQRNTCWKAWQAVPEVNGQE